ncbi:hypothetical protein AALP_AA5G245900, partial [Arabis alpina]
MPLWYDKEHQISFVYLHPEKRIVSKLNLRPGFAVFVNNKRKKHCRNFQVFVTRILELQGNAPIDKFVLKILDRKDPGLLHKATDKCGDMCLCKPREEEKDEVPSCLSSSLVKVVKILMNDGKIEKQIEQVKHFLETMQHLEELVLYCDSSFDEEVSSQLQKLTPVASPKCKVKLIPN